MGGILNKSFQILYVLALNIFGAETIIIWFQTFTDLRLSSLQFGLFRKSLSGFTPESCRLFLRRSSSMREGLNFRAEARDSQLTSDKLQDFNLNKVKE